MITISIPIGPEARHIKYLYQCLDSIYKQTILPSEILIVNDMNNLNENFIRNESEVMGPIIRMYNSPWHLGVAHAFNFGVALAHNDYVIMLGADDTLEPTTVEECLKFIDMAQKPDMTYYWFGVRYSDDRPDQFIPCNAAMVSKNLWNRTGGFATESAVGACDASYISTFGYGNRFKGIVDFIQTGKEPLYNYRVRKGSDTNMKVGTWQIPIMSTRDILTNTYELPKWGRYE